MKNFEPLAQALYANGWDYQVLNDLPENIWFHDVWELCSTWSPVGARVFLSFLVDPDNHKTPKENHIWCVTLSSTQPVGPWDGYQIRTSPKWPDRQKEIISKVNEMRRAARS